MNKSACQDSPFGVLGKVSPEFTRETETARVGRENGVQKMKPLIEGTHFGSITIGGKLYEHDIVIGVNGKVRKRKKKLSKAIYGTSHKVSLEEAEHIFEDGAKRLIIGTGQEGNVVLSEEAAGYFRRQGCLVRLLPTPDAIMAWNAEKGAVIGMFHVTC